MNFVDPPKMGSKPYYSILRKEALETLAQKAKFSQHTLTAEELEQFTAYLTDARHQLEQKPLYLRLVYMYLYAVI